MAFKGVAINASFAYIIIYSVWAVFVLENSSLKSAAAKMPQTMTIIEQMIVMGVKTLDLNIDFSNIEAQLNGIAESYFGTDVKKEA